MHSALQPALRRFFAAILSLARRIVVGAALITAALHAQTVIPLTIQNASFESPSPTVFPDYTIGATGWTRARNDVDAGTFAPGSAMPPVTPAPIDGSQVGYANGFGGLQQVLTDTLQGNILYTFSVSIGFRSDELNSETGTGAITLGRFTSGEFVPLASASTTVAKGNFNYVSGTYIAQAADLGESLAIRIGSTSDFQIVFDVVSLTATVLPIPEPATTGVLAGLVVLAWARLRRRSSA